MCNLSSQSHFSSSYCYILNEEICTCVIFIIPDLSLSSSVDSLCLEQPFEFELQQPFIMNNQNQNDIIRRRYESLHQLLHNTQDLEDTNSKQKLLHSSNLKSHSDYCLLGYVIRASMKCNKHFSYSVGTNAKTKVQKYKRRTPKQRTSTVSLILNMTLIIKNNINSTYQ